MDGEEGSLRDQPTAVGVEAKPLQLMESVAAGRRRRRRRSAKDLISGLPDEILHSILLRLPSTAAAARTSLLSRRRRRVWARMPELVLGGRRAGQAPSALLDSVDAALSAYSAPTLRRLGIELIRGSRCDVPAHRVAPWLRLASQRLTGTLDLSLPLPDDARADGDDELLLSLCERATGIRLFFGRSFVLRPPPAGSFTALTDLQVIRATMDGRELGRLVSSQCRALGSVILVALVAVCDVSIRSKSLESLQYNAKNTGKLEVAAPILEEISVSQATKAYIDAPKLEKAVWHKDAYDPGRHQFAVAG